MTLLKGEKAPNYKGGEINRGKYKMLLRSDHPFCDSQGYVRKHRLALEKHYSEVFGIPIFILPYFDVHHKDGNIDNNNWQNLEMMHRREHTKIHNPKIDRTDFKCIYPNCKKPYETFITKEGFPHWYKYKNGWICSRCYRQLTKKPEEKEKYKEYYNRNIEKMRTKSLRYYYKKKN